MAANVDTLLPNAKDFMTKLALAEAEEADRERQAHARAEAEKQALIDQLKKPSGIADEDRIKRVVAVIERAVQHGQTEIQVYRFPNSLCTDRGRAINQQEKGWENTLTGIPKELYDLWERQFRDKGYKLRVEIIDFPNGMPGDLAMTLSWV